MVHAETSNNFQPVKARGNLVLAAMIFAVGMTFIDMTIVSIAIPDIQKDLGISDTAVQWVVNGYLLSLSATFALGGRLGDTFGKKRMVTIGIVVFAFASGMCGLTPSGNASAEWIIGFRVLQGIGAALMIPAALALVISAFPLERRGRALALFFGITGALTSIGPIAGGYLTQIDWRAIFWINLPIALIALALVWISRAENESSPAPIDYLGAALVTGGMTFSVLGLQQASDWGWGSSKVIGSLILGTLLLLVFAAHELRVSDPLIRVRIFRDRAFASENGVLFLLMIVFVPLFFFASTYAQVALGKNPSQAGLYLLNFFAGFAISTQIGGRILDKRGAKPAVVIGSALAAVGFYLWADSMTSLDWGTQWQWIALAGFGMGLVLGPANTDAINRAPETSYGEATGITQTVRNYGSSLGMAVLGTVLITQNRLNIESGLERLGIPKSAADGIAEKVKHGGGGNTGGGSNSDQAVWKTIQAAYADSTQTIFMIMGGVLALLFLFALVAVPSGKTEEVVAEGTYDS